MRKNLIGICIITLLMLAAGCASIGNPSGGPRDEDPPRFVGASPLMGATEVSPQKVVLTFDEFVTLKDAFSKVVVSPPGAQVPRVSSLGRRVTVEMRDTLLPNTTYTIDFGNSIVDNNEGNPLENFMYTFSTGPVLDTLMVSGMVLGAEDLEAPTGMYVGLHSDLNDSTFARKRFDRIAKTDDKGRFVIGGLAPGKYRIYALDDRDGDLKWSSPEETLAFYDLVIEPSAEMTVATDTIFNLITGDVDSLVSRTRTRFLPNNILLRSYNTGFKQQYITKYERVDSTRLNFIFNAPAEQLPRIEVVTTDGLTLPIEEISLTERSATNDTLSFWLRNPDIIARDTLRVALEYLRADSTYTLQPVNDTVRMLTNRPIVRSKKNTSNKKGEAVDSLPPPVPTISIMPRNSKPEVNQSITLEMPVPLEEFNSSMVHLEFKEDTLWFPVEDFDRDNLRFDSLNPRNLTVSYPWKYETGYRLTVDSLAGKSIYGLFTDDLKLEFTTRPETEYGSLKFNVTNVGPQTTPRFVQLLDQQGKPLRKLPVENGSVTFRYLLPGKYNVRIVEDSNGNGIWDPGDIYAGIQPDLTYYYKETIELKANWDQEIDWNVFATPVDKQKPESIRNKKNNNGRY